jgi:hypothetical protein
LVLSHHETVEQCCELVKTIKRQNMHDGNGPEAPDPTSRLAGSAIVGSPGSHPVS